MRKGFEELSALVGTVLDEQVKSGALLLLATGAGRGSRSCIGMAAVYGSEQTLGEGSSAWPKPGDGIGGSSPWSRSPSMLMDGNRSARARMRPWYQRD